MYRASFALCLVGALILVLAIALPFVFPYIFEKQLTEKLVIRPDSEMIKKFKKVPVPQYFQVYMFNLTNANDVLQGAKPKLHELGPYTYRMQKERVNVKFNHTIGTVTSDTVISYYFKPEMSIGKESDLITTIDLLFIALASKINSETTSPAIKGAIKLWFLRFNLTPFMTHTVGEILFHGYDEPVLKELYPMTKLESHRLGKTGFYYMRNGTVGNEVEVFSGELGNENYQHLFTFNGQKRLDIWSEERCNLLNGTDGSQYARPIDLSKPLYMFSASLCRSVYFLYEREIQLGPLTLHRVVLPPELLTKSDMNNCFCSSNFTCRSSLVDLSPCKGGNPIIASTPHFLNGNTAEINAVEGLKPMKEVHEIFLDIETTTGVTMRSAKRIQVNLPLRRYADFPVLAKVPEIIFPVFWFNESAEATLEMANKMYVSLTVPVTVVKYGAWALLIVGLILVLIGALLTRKVYKNNQNLYKRRQELRDRIFDTNGIKLLEEKNPVL